MAIAVVGGVALSTLLTLFVVPCAYETFSGFQRRPSQKDAKENGKSQPKEKE